MALFLKQNQTRSQLQERIANDLEKRVQAQMADGDKDKKIGETMLEDSQEATGRSMFWVGVVTMSVIALVFFVLLIFNGV